MDKNELADFIANNNGKVKEAYNAFMKVNGHRGVSETELRSDCWADDIVSFCDTLKGVIATYDKERVKVEKTWTDYLDELLEPVKPSKRKKIKGLVIKARSGAWHREYTKSKCMLTTSMFRRAYRTIAQKLMEKGLLPDIDLIYFFTHEEVGKLIKGDKSLVKKAMKRRRLYPIQYALRFEEVYSGKPVPIKDDLDMQGKTEFVGLPASPGIVSGKVRIIRSVEDANNLQEGEIMVASCTDVGWTPYYCLAAGLITEIGSCLSHGVVVAREYGLPTIVNARNIMQAVNNGDEITMDGSTGVITIKKAD
jgi:pyruvate,water dikinase